MALDTRVKRLSMMNYVSRSLLPDPTGSFDQGDRQTLLDRYSGILFQDVGADDLIAQSRTISRFVFSRVFGRVN